MNYLERVNEICSVCRKMVNYGNEFYYYLLFCYGEICYNMSLVIMSVVDNDYGAILYS